MRGNKSVFCKKIYTFTVKPPYFKTLLNPILTMSLRLFPTLLLLLFFFQNAWSQWDTLQFQTPSTTLTAASRYNDRLLAGHGLGLSYTDDYGAHWQRAQNGPRNTYMIWTRQDKVYASAVRNGKDSTWISDDGGLSFQFWGAVGLSGPVSKVIREDTMLLVSYENVVRQLRGSDDNEAIFTAPAFNYNLRMVEFGQRLLLLSTDGIRWSDNNGVTWQKSISNIPINNQGVGYDRLLVHGSSIFYNNQVGVLMRSDDSGETWNSLPFFNGSFILNMLEEGDALLATRRDDMGIISQWRSTDNGVTWTQVYPQIDFTETMFKSYLTPGGKRLLTNTNCYAISEDETQWETRQSGLPTSPFLDALKTGPASWVVVDQYRLYTTFDGGITYRLVRYFQSGFAGEIQQINGVILINYDGQHGFLRSEDNGETWTFDDPDAPFIQTFRYLGGQQVLVLAFGFALYSYDIDTQEFQPLPGNVENVYRMQVLNGLIFTNSPIGDGIQVSLDTGQTFVPANNGLPFGFICEELFVVGERVFAKSAEYGLYMSDNQGGSWAYLPGPPEEPFINPTLMTGVGDRVFATNSARTVYSDSGGDPWFLSNVPPAGIFSEFYIAGVDFLKTFGDDVYMSMTVYYPGSNTAVALMVHTKVSELVLLKLQGRIFADSNNNQQMDGDEQGVPHVLVFTQNNQHYALSNAQGYFALLYDSPDILKPVLPYSFLTASPIQYAVNQPADSLDFALYSDTNDIHILLTDNTVPRPGFTLSLTGYVQNASLQPADATVKLVPAPGYEFLHAEPPAVLQNDTIVWSNIALSPLGNALVSATVRLSESVPISATLQNIACVETNTWPDDLPENNLDTLLQTVVGSFDPNDKTALQGYTVPIADIQAEKRLDYLIRFQNTGNYPATFVRILDTLETDFNPLTFRLDAASHPVRVRFVQPRVLEFFFDQIHLPDSISDEAGSHGFVQYSIAALPNLADGDSLTNTASIYFDYNAPVVTNTAVTIVDDAAGVTEMPGALEFSMGPNPASAHQPVLIQLIANEAFVSVQVFDSAGKSLIQQTLANGSRQVQLRGLPAGAYVVQVSAEGRTGARILVVR